MERGKEQEFGMQGGIMDLQDGSRKNRRSWIAAFLSFVIPGVGQMYNSRILVGFIWLVLTVVGYVLLIIPGLILHFICVGLAFRGATAEKRPLLGGLAVSFVLFAAGAGVSMLAFSQAQMDFVFDKAKSFCDFDFNFDAVKSRAAGIFDFSPGTVDKNEAMAISALRQYASAEEAFYNKHTRYTRIPGELMAAGSLPNEIAMANMPATGIDYHGYYFLHVKKQGQGDVDLRKGFVICAAPVKYGVTGKRTFVVGQRGEVLSKDTAGMPVKDAAKVDGTWEKE